MRLKSFTAPTIHEAMSLVRKELGEDAIIVSTQSKTNRGGVRITAAIESPLEKAALTHGETYSSVESPTSANTIEKVRERLMEQGLPPRLMEELLQHIPPSTTRAPSLLLAEALDKIFIFDPIADDLANQSYIFVGPPGAGKTISLVKMATKAKMSHKNTEIITTDTIRAGAIGQLASFTKLLKIDLKIANSLQELQDSLVDIPIDIPVLIDTPGINPFEDQAIEEIMNYIEVVNAEPLLVLPSGIDPVEALEIAQRFSEIGVRKILGTRVDISRRLGGTLYAAYGAELALCNFGATPHIVEGLVPINSALLSKLLLFDRNQSLSTDFYRKSNAS